MLVDSSHSSKPLISDSVICRLQLRILNLTNANIAVLPISTARMPSVEYLRPSCCKTETLILQIKGLMLVDSSHWSTALLLTLSVADCS
jgi:hypothetical protein